MSLKLLGLMRRANALSIGQDKAIPSVRNGKAKLLLIPSDATDRTVKNAESAVKDSSVQLIQVPYTSSEMARAIGIDNCMMLAINDEGFAKSFRKSLTKEITEGM